MKGRPAPASARVLQLLRHAKSSWKDPGLADRDRPLNARGRAAAGLVGARLRAAGAAPGLILCSPARRARETGELLAAELATPPEIRRDERLYMADPGRILEVLRALGGDAPPTVMAIGHNPGMQALAARLAAGVDPGAAERLRGKFPTAALAECEFRAAGWRGLDAAAVTAMRVSAPARNREQGGRAAPVKPCR